MISNLPLKYKIYSLISAKKGTENWTQLHKTNKPQQRNYLLSLLFMRLQYEKFPQRPRDLVTQQH